MTTDLGALTIRDEWRLQRRLQRGATVDDLASEIAAAERRVQRRRDAVPVITYPLDLPIVDRREDLLAAISDHQVVVVAGETGSGKTTQIPKMCIELGRGVRGMIGHTQPRRIAARAVAERIAAETETELGKAVGYAVRFTDRVSDTTVVKVMTDGILLAELHRDPDLAAYDTVIVDEAHERSLNIDFLIGYLTRLLPRRPDLKVIVTSATIDTAKFSAQFGGVPVIDVSGRTYPVEVRYRPFGVDEGDDRDQVQAVVDAVDELAPTGDTLVFLSGEREIRDTAEALARDQSLDVVPLYARLSTGEQHRVFAPHAGRRIVLATNIAETSLTVPGIRSVVDAGRARMSRYNRRTKVQRLPIEPISQASANQRAGRCGREAPGVCIRLYTAEDFDGRPEFTEPEIQRTNLASVILRMSALGLGEVADFPFVDPPDTRAVNDGIALLEEIGALEPGGRLTPIGGQLTRLPIDPRLGRMLLESGREGCLREMLAITSGLTIQDPRERPLEQRDAANTAHARFADAASDFTSIVNLWTYLEDRQRNLSGNQFRRLCRAEFLHYLRVREWQDLHAQLTRVTDELGLTVNMTAPHPDRIHVSALTGLLSHIGMRYQDRPEYRGARDSRFTIVPGSALAKKPPRWVMAAELVEHERMRARVLAHIEPVWAERLGAHLVKRSYGDPRWEPSRGAALVDERVSLYGLPLINGRVVEYRTIDRAAARAMFIHHALVTGDWTATHDFLDANARRIDEVRRLEDRARRPVLVDAAIIADWYDARVPADITTGREFDRWWRRAQPGALDLPFDALVDPRAGPIRLDDFPDSWDVDGLHLPLSYVFDPGADDDGVTVDVPLAVLNRLPDDGFDWNIPGLRPSLVGGLIRSLPKAVRRDLVPVAAVSAAFLEDAHPSDGPLLTQLSHALGVPFDAWRLDQVPPYLRMTFRITSRKRVLATGKDLPALRRGLDEVLREAIARATRAATLQGQTGWTWGPLRRRLDGVLDGYPVYAYPSIVDEGDAVGIRALPTEREQSGSMWSGTARLLALQVNVSRRDLGRRLGNDAQLGLPRVLGGSVDDLIDDCVLAAMDQLLVRHGGPAWDEEAFRVLLKAVQGDAMSTAVAVATFAGRIVAEAASITTRLDALTATSLSEAVADMRNQVGGLVYRRFVALAGTAKLPDLLRYLRAVSRRLDKLAGDIGRDRDKTRRVRELIDEFDRATVRSTDPVRRSEVRWMIEELRVSLFAQQLGTSGPISEKRVRTAIAAL